jgi:uncharacterized membrane protein YphA (DoxX/SURF4 family)
MKVVTVILQIVLGLIFMLAGVMKLFTPYDELVQEENMAWALDFSSSHVLLIGGFELVFSLILLAGVFLKKLTPYLPIVGALFTIQMVAALIVHARRDEMDAVYINITILIFAVTFAILRFNLNSRKGV